MPREDLNVILVDDYLIEHPRGVAGQTTGVLPTVHRSVETLKVAMSKGLISLCCRPGPVTFVAAHIA
jgi:hypothetical protein